jgi:hypothetical protein
MWMPEFLFMVRHRNSLASILENPSHSVMVSLSRWRLQQKRSMVCSALDIVGWLV